MTTKEEINNSLKAKLHEPFGPMLMEFSIPNIYVNFLNKYGDKISKSENKSKKLDWSNNLIGNVKQEHKIEDSIWNEKPDKDTPNFLYWVGNCVNIYVKTYLSKYGDEVDKELIRTKQMKKIELLTSWLVNQIAGDFNPPHMHKGMVSAAGWLKVPESIEKNEEREEAGYIEWLFADPHPFVNPKFSFKPQVGKIMLFPSWLQHQVYPFRGKGTRRSISFNVNFKY